MITKRSRGDEEATGKENEVADEAIMIKAASPPASDAAALTITHSLVIVTHQLVVITRQLVTITHQLVIITRQLVIIAHQLVIVTRRTPRSPPRPWHPPCSRP